MFRHLHFPPARPRRSRRNENLAHGAGMTLQFVRPDIRQSCILLAAVKSWASHSPSARIATAIASPAIAPRRFPPCSGSVISRSVPETVDMKHPAPRFAITTIPDGPDVPAIASDASNQTHRRAIGALTSHASVHASVSGSPQLFCSSEGTVVLIHGFAPPGLAFNHRGWGNFIHTQFLPGGRRASLRPFQSADRHTPIAAQ
jgi:hypothetical protein